MSKPKSPLSSIVSLKGLELLYAIARKIPVGKISDKKYFEELQKRLYADNVGVGSKSRNFVTKFMGEPVEVKNDNVSGLETTILDALVKIVYKELGLEKLFPNIGNIDDKTYPYLVFESEIFQTPKHLLPLNENKYYRYLDSGEKQAVDSFVEQRLVELVPSYSKGIFYIMHAADRQWILQLQPEKKFGFLSLVRKNDSGLIVESNFSIPPGGYNCIDEFIFLQIKNSSDKYLHSLVLVSNETELEKHFIFGTLTYIDARRNLITCSIVLEKKDSYSEAYKAIKESSFKDYEQTRNFLKDKTIMII